MSVVLDKYVDVMNHDIVPLTTNKVFKAQRAMGEMAAVVRSSLVVCVTHCKHIAWSTQLSLLVLGLWCHRGASIDNRPTPCL